MEKMSKSPQKMHNNQNYGERILIPQGQEIVKTPQKRKKRYLRTFFPDPVSHPLA
jgi:hypothetical protein